MNKLEFDDFFSPSSIRDALRLMIDEDGSDMHIVPKKHLTIEKSRRFNVISKHTLSYDEVFAIANSLYGSDSASAFIESGKYIDKDFEIRYKKRGTSNILPYRFRINIFPVMVHGNISPSLTLRMLPPDPPEWKKMGYGEQLWKAFRPQGGLVLVTGPTGSGKSTLLASGIRRLLETRSNEKIITLEDPIEYVYDRFIDERNILEQSAVGINAPSFMEAMRPMLRRRPTIVLVGEARDAETIRAAIYVAQTGHLVYSTTHTNGVPETIKRLLNEFPVNEHDSRLSDIISVSRLYIAQRLLPSADGKVVAVREILHFTNEVRRELEGANIHNILKVARKVTNKYGVSMVQHAKMYLDKGLITKQQFSALAEEFSREG